jgi:hypothetical protein
MQIYTGVEEFRVDKIRLEARALRMNKNIFYMSETTIMKF